MRLPLFPPLVAAGFVLSEFAASNAPLEALGRPLAVAIGCAFVLQALLSGIARSRDRGAFLALLLLLVLIGLPLLALGLGAALGIGILVALRRRIRLHDLPWTKSARMTDAVVAVSIALVVGGAGLEGAFRPAATSGLAPLGEPAGDLPDIYLLMLDGYPRADTLLTDFALDNDPFLTSMENLGFTVATESRSNYVMTVLTLASVMNGAQISELVPDPPRSVSAQFRAVARIINEGSKLSAFRTAGYEVLTIPSGYYESSLVSADRFLDSGELSTFEMDLLTSGGIRLLVSRFHASWLPDEHRSRIRKAFESLGNLAAERTVRPKLVFAHILAPHMPIAFTRDGQAAAPLPCFPAACSLYDFGDTYERSRRELMRDQIVWLNSAVLDAVQAILARSETPPVIVIFSDHGLRHRYDDREELFRSLFLAATPGHHHLFPNDTSPVNLLTRLLNAYTNARHSLSSEESYWSETRDVGRTGLFQLERWPIPAN